MLKCHHRQQSVPITLHIHHRQQSVSITLHIHHRQQSVSITLDTLHCQLKWDHWSQQRLFLVRKSNVLNNRLFSNYNQKFSQIVFQIYLWISFVTSSFLLEFPQN